MGDAKSMTATRYVLKELFEPYEELEVDKDTANEIRKSYDFLDACSKLEDLFSLVAIGYGEFEKFIFEASLRNHIDGYSSTGEPIELRYGQLKDEANQKLLSLANAYRALCDQSSPRLSKAEALRPNVRKDFKLVLAKAFDDHFEFRLFDFLRNMITHHEMPITSATILSATLAKDDKRFDQSPFINRTTLELLISKSQVVETPKGRKKTKDEVRLIQMANIDAKYIIRGFVAALFKGRSEFHKQIDDAHSTAAENFSVAYDMFMSVYQRDSRFLELHKQSDNSSVRICPVKQTFPELVTVQKNRARRLIQAGHSYPSVEISKQANVYCGENKALWRR